MSSPFAQPPSHPFIGFIVGEMQNTYYLMGQGQCGIALENMIKLLHSVDPEARKKQNWKDLDSDLYKTMQARRSVEDTDPLVLQTRLASFDYDYYRGYVGLYSRLWLIFWDNKYLYQMTYMGVIPASMLEKKRDVPEEKAFPERLSEDLR